MSSLLINFVGKQKLVHSKNLSNQIFCFWESLRWTHLLYYVVTPLFEYPHTYVLYQAYMKESNFQKKRKTVTLASNFFGGVFFPPHFSLLLVCVGVVVNNKSKHFCSSFCVSPTPSTTTTKHIQHINLITSSPHSQNKRNAICTLYSSLQCLRYGTPVSRLCNFFWCTYINIHTSRLPDTLY